MKCGDYVCVLAGVHDDRMPKNRRDGLIVEIVGSRKDQAIVMFSNQNFLKFHASQLKTIVKIPDLG
jgi:hypothetical protein